MTISDRTTPFDPQLAEAASGLRFPEGPIALRDGLNESREQGEL
jgi:hypothetical protein